MGTGTPTLNSSRLAFSNFSFLQQPCAPWELSHGGTYLVRLTNRPRPWAWLRRSAAAGPGQLGAVQSAASGASQRAQPRSRCIPEVVRYEASELRALPLPLPEIICITSFGRNRQSHPSNQPTSAFRYGRPNISRELRLIVVLPAHRSTAGTGSPRGSQGRVGYRHTVQPPPPFIEYGVGPASAFAPSLKQMFTSSTSAQFRLCQPRQSC